MDKAILFGNQGITVMTTMPFTVNEVWCNKHTEYIRDTLQALLRSPI